MTDENHTNNSGQTPEDPASEQEGANVDAPDNAASGAASRADAAAETNAGVRRGGNEVNLEALLKVPVSLSIEVGRKKVRLDDVLDTEEGSVIELDKLLNEPLDILVNGALIAHGVIVLAQERFGIQITDILSPEERARSL
jgi:flagellar motor switch protein FliN/FliY